MEFNEVLRSRRSIRAFKPDPVPLNVLKEVISQCVWAPSWANTQPWEFVVAGGSKLQEIIKQWIAKNGERAYPDIARPPEFPEVYLNRIQKARSAGPPASKEEMHKHMVDSWSHYYAPAVIYIMIDKSFFYTSRGTNVWSLYDCGAVAQNIGLIAANLGLGTVEQAQAVTYPDILRNVLGTPESKLFAIGIAIGYPDWENPALKVPRSTREPVENIARFIGF
jgi:nitroreductase